jgi:phage N-6-adenine-methyltransferase
MSAPGNVRRSLGRDDWETPWELVKALEGVLGTSFTLDVCATWETKKASMYYSLDDDGLSSSAAWCGVVWCNPPYSNLRAWVEKALDEAQKDHCELLAMLVPAATDTMWFHRLVEAASVTLLLKGRVAFLKDGVPQKGNTTASAVVLFAKGQVSGELLLWDWKKRAYPGGFTKWWRAMPWVSTASNAGGSKLPQHGSAASDALLASRSARSAAESSWAIPTYQSYP